MNDFMDYEVPPIKELTLPEMLESLTSDFRRVAISQGSIFGRLGGFSEAIGFRLNESGLNLREFKDAMTSAAVHISPPTVPPIPPLSTLKGPPKNLGPRSGQSFDRRGRKTL